MVGWSETEASSIGSSNLRYRLDLPTEQTTILSHMNLKKWPMTDTLPSILNRRLTWTTLRQSCVIFLVDSSRILAIETQAFFCFCHWFCVLFEVVFVFLGSAFLTNPTLGRRLWYLERTVDRYFCLNSYMVHHAGFLGSTKNEGLMVILLVNTQ